MGNHRLHLDDMLVREWSEKWKRRMGLNKVLCLGRTVLAEWKWVMIRWSFALIFMSSSAWLLFFTSSCAPGQGYLLLLFTLDDFLYQRFKTFSHFSVFNWDKRFYFPMKTLWGRHVPWPLPNQEKLFGGWEMGGQVGL